MKTEFLLLLMLFLCATARAQEEAIVDGVTYQLDTENHTATLRYCTQDKAGTYAIPENITVGENSYTVNSMLYNSFSYCMQLTGIQIPRTVTNYEPGAISYCYNLATVEVAKDNPVYTSVAGVLYSKDKTTLYCVPMGYRGEYDIPEGTTNLERYATNGCRWLTKVNVPASVTRIEDYQFFSCSDLTEITVASDNPSFTSSGGVLFSKDQTLLCKYPEGKKEESYTMPAGVKRIGMTAFAGCKLTSIELPAGLEELVTCAFQQCNLSDIRIPDGVKSIGSYAFLLCEKLVSVTLPSQLKMLGAGAFSQCGELRNIVLPETLTAVEPMTFADCKALKRLTVPDQVERIGYAAFQRCEGLETIDFPDSLALIDTIAFQGCSKLNWAYLPGKLTQISYGAFESCGIYDLMLPPSVKRIEASAFAGCTDLKEINCNAPIPPVIEAETFSDYTVTLYVPEGCGPLYRQAEVWKNFTHIKEDFPIGITSTLQTGKPVYANGMLQLPLPARVTVYDPCGTIVCRRDCPEGRFSLEFLTAGTYLVTVETDGNIQQIKISR